MISIIAIILGIILLTNNNIIIAPELQQAAPAELPRRGQAAHLGLLSLSLSLSLSLV